MHHFLGEVLEAALGRVVIVHDLGISPGVVLGRPTSAMRLIGLKRDG